MVEIFGTLERSVEKDGQQTLIFRIPALTATLAKQRGKINARLKGISNFSVGETRKLSGSRYEITIVTN